MHQSEFIALIAPFKDKVFRIARRLLVSTEEAQDATQEIMLKLWVQNDKLKDYKSVDALAITMTKNYCFDQLKSKRAGNISLVHNNYSDGSNSLQENLENCDSVSFIEKIVAKLPQQQKMIVQLRDIEGYELDEIAEMLNMNNGSVRTALSRARQVIKESITKTHGYGIGKN